jgi:hypothetical protein
LAQITARAWQGSTRSFPGWQAPRWMDRRLKHDPEKCAAVFRKDHALNNNLERDGDSILIASRFSPA